MRKMLLLLIGALVVGNVVGSLMGKLEVESFRHHLSGVLPPATGIALCVLVVAVGYILSAKLRHEKPRLSMGVIVVAILIDFVILSFTDLSFLPSSIGQLNLIDLLLIVGLGALLLFKWRRQ